MAEPSNETTPNQESVKGSKSKSRSKGKSEVQNASPYDPSFEKRIIEHLMYSGKAEEQNTSRARLRNKTRNKKPKVKQDDSKRKDLDVDSVLAFIEGRKPAKKTKQKNKKKKQKNKKHKKPGPKHAKPAVEVKVKTEAERFYKRVCLDESGGLRACVAGTSVCGSWRQPSLYLPEKDVRFEATTLDTPAQHLFLSEIDRTRTYGLCYQCDNSQFVSCAESAYDPLVNFLKAWSSLQGGEEAMEEAEAVEDVKVGDDDDAEQDEDEKSAGDEEEMDGEGEEGLVYVTYDNGSSLEYGEVGGWVHAFESAENCLAYCFSKEEDPRRYSLTYISKSSPAFFRRRNTILKADLILVNCNFLDTPEDLKPGEISWKQLQPFISEHADSTFLLHSFDSSLSPSSIFAYFDSLVTASELDLSNVHLFVPPVESEV